MDQESYRNLIAGRNDGRARGLLRLLLCVISVAYRSVVAMRNWGYNIGLLRSFHAEVPVICVGNITTGGTGKTPIVIWLCGLLSEKGLRCAVLTRGYKAELGKDADEPAIMAKSCPEAKIIVNADRITAAKKAINEFDANVLVMDDGFQHRRLARDLDIVAIDAMCPFGYGRTLPAGMLREPVKAIRRADAVVITRCDQVERDDVEKLEKKIRQLTPGIVIAKAVHKQTCAKTMNGQILSIEEVKEKKIFTFCGIGNPKAFGNGVNKLGMDVVGSKVYNDHHNYTQKDMSAIYDEAKRSGAELILSTQKDWVKTAMLLQKTDDIIFAYLVVELVFIDGSDRIEALVEETIRI